MDQGKIYKHLVRLAAPAIVAQLVNALYNIIDRIFIGHIPGIGGIAMTGIGITFPVTITITAFSSLIGKGGAPLVGISLGAGEKERAEKILGNSVSLLFILSLFLTIGLLIFKRPILYAFGASDATFLYADEFISIYVLGNIFVLLALGLNTFISIQGHARTAMFSIIIGAIVNIALDAIFIYGFGMGVKGAALATVLAQGVSAAWVVTFLCSGKSNIRIKTKNLKLDKKIVRNILQLGISPLTIESTTGLINIILNVQLGRYGNDMYIGTLTIMTSIMQLIFIPMSGITQGAQPIISFNYGAGNQKRVLDTFKLTLGSTFIFGLTALVILLFNEREIVGIFSNNQELLALTAEKMPIYFGGLWAISIHVSCQTIFLAIGQSKISIFLVMFRKIIVMIPLAYLLPRFAGIDGIYLATAIADISAACMTFCIFCFNIRRILGKRYETISSGIVNRQQIAE